MCTILFLLRETQKSKALSVPGQWGQRFGMIWINDQVIGFILDMLCLVLSFLQNVQIYLYPVHETQSILKNIMAAERSFRCHEQTKIQVVEFTHPKFTYSTSKIQIKKGCNEQTLLINKIKIKIF